ncbi:MAG: hypothetical protein ABS70_07805 [Nitrospira sp. SCN 59-13]|nr:MAG: hypothetical protein ABS70_07805 [Nitrospira sp. SCN 59-13]
MLLFCLTVGTAEAAPVPTRPAEEPDLELLDFLGSWQDENGHWVDPFTITNDQIPQPSAESKPNRSGMSSDAQKPAPEIPSSSAKDRSRNPVRMQTGP